MIRILDCKKPNYLSRLKLILNKRRFKSKINTDIVIKIVKDIKKNKKKALLKYEKKFSKNAKIKPTKKEINKSTNRCKGNFCEIIYLVGNFNSFSSLNYLI